MALYDGLETGSIRLLKPFRYADQQITLELLSINLDNAPTYIAMSYCWEGQIPDIEVAVRGNRRRLVITRNVESLLKLMLRIEPGLYLWIDAISINQSDIAEKNTQIPLMAQIYQKAIKCIAWLGEGNHRVEATIKALPNMLEAAQSWQGQPETGPSDEQCDQMEVSQDMREAWSGLEDLMGLAWFRRVWVIQEAVIPDNFNAIYGTIAIDLEALTQLATTYDTYSEPKLTREKQTSRTEGQIAWQNIVSLRRTRRKQFQSDEGFQAPHKKDDLGEELPRLVSMAQHSNASNPLDHIYGIVGLACRHWQAALPIEYDMDARQLYTRFTRLWHLFDCRMDFLILSSPLTSIPGLPSWCPDYSIYVNTSWQPLSNPIGLYAKSGYHAGFSRRLWEVDVCSANHGVAANHHYLMMGAPHIWAEKALPFPESLEKLEVDGFEIDEANVVIPPVWESQSGPHSVDDWLELFAWDSQCLSLSKSVFSTEDTPAAHWRTITANVDLNYEKLTADLSKVYEVARVVFGGSYVFPENVSDFSQVPGFAECKPYLVEFAKQVGAICEARCFFSTVRGRIGIGPEFMKPGDPVYIVNGTRTPFILRKSKEPGCHVLLGEAYIDGLMGGEALDSRDFEANETITLI